MILILLLGLPALLLLAAITAQPLRRPASAVDWESTDDADDDPELPMGNWE